MVFISNRASTDPAVNFALEEYCLRNLDVRHPHLLLYVNRPAVVIGRNQNPFQETDIRFLRRKNIQLVRRVSGGGAVYHDFGNLNFSFITRYDRRYFANFRHFTEPILSALNRMGVPAELNGRNDILVRGLKISGNAQYSTGKAMLSHGTLLLNSDLKILEQALRGSDIEIRSKAHPSIRSRVANISDFLAAPLDMDSFRSALLKAFFKPFGGVREFHLPDDGWRRALQLSESKYQSWEWTHGRSPKFLIRRVHRFGSGIIQIQITVERGIIRKIEILSDSRPIETPADISNRLIGGRFTAEGIHQAFNSLDPDSPLGPCSAGEFTDFLASLF